MVTYNYFFCYVLLLVLQGPGPLHAQEPPATSPSPQTDSKQVTSATSISRTTSISSTTDEPQQTENYTPVSSIGPASEVPNLNATGIKSTPDLNTTNENNNVLDLVPEFPQEPGNGTKIVYADRTMDTPILNLTNTGSPQPTANSTNVECPTDMNLASPNATEVKTSTSSINKTDAEVPDLLHDDLEEVEDVSKISALPPNITLNISQAIDRDTEYREDELKTEDVLRISSKTEEGSSIPAVPLVQGQLAAILAGVFVVISIIAYFGLLSWRRYLENRYGNRQMLINEDDFNDRDDMRHFSI